MPNLCFTRGEGNDSCFIKFHDNEDLMNAHVKKKSKEAEEPDSDA